MTQNKGKPRIFHSAALLSPPSGILAQMEWEQDAAKSLGIEWQVKMYCPTNSQNRATVMHYDDTIDAKKLQSPAYKLHAWIKLRRNYHRWLLAQQNIFDIFLLRYYVHDPYQWAFVQHCKKPVYFVHHTLEVPELALPGGVSGFVRSKLETLIGRQTIAKAKGIIGVTQEIVDYELARSDCPNKAGLLYPNGIFFKELPLEDKRSLDLPELLFVANFAPWHGLDILLKNIQQSKNQFVLHLVGKIPSELCDLTKDPRVKVHGPLNQRQIIELSAQCWIGLSSFALFRQKMMQACPLKVREYLMLGLPVYGNYQDVFPCGVDYFKGGDDSIKDLLKFTLDTRSLTKNEVAQHSKIWIDKKDLLRNLYQNLTATY